MHTNTHQHTQIGAGQTQGQVYRALRPQTREHHAQKHHLSAGSDAYAYSTLPFSAYAYSTLCIHAYAYSTVCIYAYAYSTV